MYWAVAFWRKDRVQSAEAVDTNTAANVKIEGRVIMLVVPESQE